VEWHPPRAHPGAGAGPLSATVFDLLATLHSLSTGRLPLVLGYNTALLSIFYRLTGRRSVMNMDGIEWRRDRWPRHVKAWFWLNERLGCYLSNHLIADHPEILRHLATRVRASKISLIPYGADPIVDADPMLIKPHLPGEYALVVGRIVPENSILEIVRSWIRAGFSHRLVVVGTLDPKFNSYHRAVKAAAGEFVHFHGAVYDKAALDSLRLHARFHVHGHRVGGTNPSLVEGRLGRARPSLHTITSLIAGSPALIRLILATTANSFWLVRNSVWRHPNGSPSWRPPAERAIKKLAVGTLSLPVTNAPFCNGCKSFNLI
jgi:Domain of unknown function (DUF1972)